jgi:uncharacterized protein YmfQ (DUF2313 family)
MRSAADYQGQLQQLMPVGLAWSRAPDGPNVRLVAGMADELARIDARALDLCLREFYAPYTRELLPEWELEYGLPDECRTLGETLDQRIEDLLEKIRARGGQSIAYYTSLLAALGIEITVTEFTPFRAGMSRCGDRLYDRKWHDVWLVTAPTARIWRFRAGRNAVGERLRFWQENSFIECVINKLKPAQTYVIFGYRVSGDFANAFHYYDEYGNIVLKQDIVDDGNDPIFRLDEQGNVEIRENIPDGAESNVAKKTADGNIETMPMED